MTPQTNFTAYNVYRATCTRCGFVDPGDKNWSGLPSEFAMSATTTPNERELYMEFGSPVLIEQGLPDGMDTDGLGVEVHVHIYAKAFSGLSFSGEFFCLGVCDAKIDSGLSITYNNMPARKYVRVGTDLSNRWHRQFGYSQQFAESAWVTDAVVTDVSVMSYTDASPVEVLSAVTENAVSVRMRGEAFVSAMVMASGSYTPYVEIAYGIVKPEVKNARPNGGYISAHEQQLLKWEYVCEDGVTTFDAVSSPYHYIIGGRCAQYASSITLVSGDTGASQKIDIAGEDNSYRVPQETLDAGAFSWAVSVESVLGAQSDQAGAYAISTVDSVPVAEAVSPKNTYVNVDEAAVFDWTHTISTGTPQSRFELQVLLGGTWTTLMEEETAETMAVVPAAQLSSQITAWRVRTANNDGVYGDYSEPAKVILVVAPSVAGVMIAGNVKPVISWQSADQQGYEIMMDDVTTGVRYGTEKSYAWPDLLSDGAHVIKVRVVNRFGLFSPWAEALLDVANVPPASAPVLYATAIADSDVRLEWTGFAGTEMLIYRDGELIARLAQLGSAYVDHTATDRHSYFVRAVNADGNYADSASAVATIRLQDAVMAAEEAWNWIHLAYSSGAEPPVRAATLAPVYALNYYSGRRDPVVEMSKHRSATYSVTYAVSEDQAAALRGMIGKIVVHKRRGELLRGLLQGVNEARSWWGVDITLQIVEVDEP